MCFHQFDVDLSVFVIQTRATQVQISSLPQEVDGSHIDDEGLQ